MTPNAKGDKMTKSEEKKIQAILNRQAKSAKMMENVTRLQDTQGATLTTEKAEDILGRHDLKTYSMIVSMGEEIFDEANLEGWIGMEWEDVLAEV